MCTIGNSEITMNAYKVELLVVDFDDLGADGLKGILENSRYVNHCMRPEVMSIEERDIGEWYDDHPLNKVDKSNTEYNRLFGT